MNYEKGKWYASNRHDILSVYRFDCLDIQSFMYSEGYDQNGIHQLCFGGLIKTQIVGLATPSQIEQCLKAYAEKNGYVEGAVVKLDMGSLFKPIDWDIKGAERYISESDTLLDQSDIAIYINGKWAEIAKEPEPVKGIDFPNQSITTYTSGYCQRIDGSEKYLVRGEYVSIGELIQGYQKYLDNKTIIG
jgi:hypothetical protein